MKIFFFPRPLSVVFFLCSSFLFVPLSGHTATTYSYDARHRLTGATYTDGRTIAYIYDATDNRLQERMSAASGPDAASPPEQAVDAPLVPESVSHSSPQTTAASLVPRTGELATQASPGNTTDTASGQSEASEAAGNAAGRLVYEDAEDGVTARWVLEEGPSWSSVRSMYDDDRGSRVIEIHDDGLRSRFRLSGPDGKAWNDARRHVVQWSMRASEEFVITVAVQTSQGLRSVSFSPTAAGGPAPAADIAYGLDADSRNGTWRTYAVDLDQAVRHAQPDTTVVSVLGLSVSGNGLLDDIITSGRIPEGFTDVQAGTGLYAQP
jgi:RHS Repeat.